MPNDTQRIVIITGRERRRRYTAHEKVRFVEETMQPGMTVSAVARIYGLSPSLLFGWRRRMAEGGQVARNPTTRWALLAECASRKHACAIWSGCGSV